MDDPRFSHIAGDPRFKRAPRKRHKVTVDSRFKSMFTDKNFTTNYHVDKRGKELATSSKEDLKRFYNLDNEEEDVDPGTGKESVTGHGNDEEEDEASADEDIVDESEDDGRTSEGSSTDYEEALEQDVSYDWGDLTGDVERSDDVSTRLAVCNMNWDRITAQDLYVLFNSFKPQNGVIQSVKIYLSDYGKERLAKEEIEGPAELVEDDSIPLEGEGANPDLIEGDAFAREKLRQYQLNRLKYYYGIIECNDKATAEHVYDQCDGIEYENSASAIDVRFVPSDTEFSDDPHSEATESTADYTPSTFFTSALQQTTVNLTWDETDPTRLKKTMASFSKDELENMDFDTYLASSDEEDTATLKEQYRKLLGVDGGKEGGEKDNDTTDDDDNEQLEISWNVGLEEETEHTNKGKNKLKHSKGVSKHDPKKQEDGKEIEDDKGFDDPFFTDVSTNKRKKKHSKITIEEKEKAEKEKNELELLMMSDDEENKKHFSIKDMTSEDKKESGKKKRKKRKLKSNDDEANIDNSDTFTVDTSDPRFSSLYESHLYAVDPTNPQYKETKGMKDILTEKRKRSKMRKLTDFDKSTTKGDHGLDPLVSSVKAKTRSFIERKKRKKQSSVIS